MSAESPAEYVERLRAENKALRRGLLEAVREKQALEEHIARQDAWMLALMQKLHGEIPARPGISDVD